VDTPKTLKHRVARPSRGRHPRSHSTALRGLSAALVATALFLLLGCASTGDNPVNPETTLSVSATPVSITNMADTSLITAQALLDGRPVVNGTRVSFTIISGDGFLRTADTQGPTVEVETTDGLARTTLVSGTDIGEVTITARTGTVGNDGSIAVTVQVIEKLSDPQLLLSPNNLLRVGGNVELTLLVTDNTGAPLRQEPVHFSTDRGSLHSNGATLYTDIGGAARDTLVLEQPSDDVVEVNVTAAVGNKVTNGKVNITTNVNPVPVIVSSPTSLTLNQTVYLDAGNSTDADGDIVSYEWWFGDGNTATGITTSHNYAESGLLYTVLLLVTDDAGATVGTTTDLYVGDLTAPTASFLYSPASPRVGETVFFNAEESSDDDGSVVSYHWDFGDGSTSDEGPTVEKTYLTDETFTVVLTVTDDDDLIGITTSTITVVDNANPTASFTADPNPASVTQFVAFNATGSTDSDGEIVSYFWDFGNGHTSDEGPLTRIRFAEDGTYEVFLTVTDNDGDQGFTSLAVTVSNFTAPTAMMSISNATPSINEKVGFDGTGSSSTDGTINSYRWDFGDGNAITSSIPLVRHSFSSSGTYAIFLEVRDDNGLKGYTTGSVTVTENEAPTAVIAVSNATPTLGETVQFDASGSTDTDGSITEYRWDFGDGSHSSDVIASHSYSDFGTFSVVLTVTDDTGAEGTAGTTVTVASGQTRPTADFTYLPAAPTTDDDVVFDGSASADTDGEIKAYRWELGDGTIVFGGPVVLRYRYAEAGTYVVTLTVIDDDSYTGNTSQELTIAAGANNNPVASFTVTPNPTVIATDTVFDGSASADPDTGDSIVSYLWDFGDGSAGNGAIITHQYAAAGDYTAQLIVQDTNGAVGTQSTTVTATSSNLKPKARLVVLAGDNGTLIVDASGSEDAEDALQDLSFQLSGHAPSGVELRIGKGHSPLRLVQVEGHTEPVGLTLILDVKDSSGNVSRLVRNLVFPLRSETSGLAPRLSLNPTRLPAPGGYVALIGSLDGTTPAANKIQALTKGSAHVQIAGQGLKRRALVQNGKPGDRVAFQMQVRDPHGRTETVTRVLELTRGETAVPPHSGLNAQVRPRSNWIVDLEARDHSPTARYDFSGFAAHTNTTVTIQTDPSRPGMATAFITGASPGDILAFALRITAANGLTTQQATRLRVPGRDGDSR